MTIDPKHSIDLSEVHRLAEAERELSKEAEDRARQVAAVRRIKAWERKMHRTFKGIYPRPVRQAMLRHALEINEEENAS